MTGIFTAASMSLDGYIAGPSETGFEHLFAWYGNGDVEVPTAQPDRTFRMTGPSAAHFRGLVDKTGVLVVGRRLFDLTGGWNGNHPLGTPVVVLTHDVPDGWPRAGAAFTFVTGGLDLALAAARDIAGDKWIGVNGGSIARQCLDAGMLDEVWISLVPVLLGGGTPLFDRLGTAPVTFEDPIVVDGTGVTHLCYRRRRPDPR